MQKPDVELLIVNYRPIKIYIDGEVENPGLHILAGARRVECLGSDNSNMTGLPNTTNNLDTIQNNVYFPSIIDGIKQAGALTINANLDNIKVKRINSLSNGSQKIKADINFLK